MDKVTTTVNTVRNTFNRATGNHGAVVASTVDNVVAQATGEISNVLSGGNTGGSLKQMGIKFQLRNIWRVLEDTI